MIAASTRMISRPSRKRIINDPENAPKLLVGTKKDATYLCVVLTADRGLCGGFNSNITKKLIFFNLKCSETLKNEVFEAAAGDFFEICECWINSPLVFSKSKTRGELI